MKWSHHEYGPDSPENAAAIAQVDDYLQQLLDGITIVEGGTYAFLFLEDTEAGRAAAIRDAVNAIWAHGWVPGFRDMHGIFVGAGPRLPSGCTVGTVEAIEVYPLLLAILGLPDRRAIRWESSLDDLLGSGDDGDCRDAGSGNGLPIE